MLLLSKKVSYQSWLHIQITRKLSTNQGSTYAHVRACTKLCRECTASKQKNNNNVDNYNALTLLLTNAEKFNFWPSTKGG